VERTGITQSFVTQRGGRVPEEIHRDETQEEQGNKKRRGVMITRIYKYQLRITDEQVIDLPRSAQLLTVQEQAGTVCLWAWVCPSEPIQSRKIRIVGTGHPIEGNLKYITTFQQFGGSLVWHVFEDLS
jgi:hypothetical protein